MMSRKREFSYWISARELRETKVQDETEEEGRKRVYIITPLGTRARRIVFCGVLTQKNQEDNMTRATINDGSSNFYVSAFANEYGMDVKNSLDSIEPGSEVFVMGRVNTYSNNDRLYVNINPETVSPTDAETRKFWAAKVRYLARRKMLAVTQARKNPSPDDLISKGYTREEAESAVRSVKHYPDFDLSQLQESVPADSIPETGKSESGNRNFVLDYIRNNDTDGMGCRYDDLVAASSNIGLEQGDLDELLNTLGSEGEIFEVSLKRYKII